MDKHGVETKLKSLLLKKTDVAEEATAWAREVMSFMKKLSPSGVELEIMTLATFDFKTQKEGQGQNELVSKQVPFNSNLSNFVTDFSFLASVGSLSSSED